MSSQRPRLAVKLHFFTLGPFVTLYTPVEAPTSGPYLMRCCRLPFGYVASPLCFCAVTEEVAQRFRARAGQAGLTGVHLLAYVDDFLLVADPEAASGQTGEPHPRGAFRWPKPLCLAV